jgi:hypothetical protein
MPHYRSMTRAARLGVDQEVPTWARLLSLAGALVVTLMLAGCFALGITV